MLFYFLFHVWVFCMSVCLCTPCVPGALGCQRLWGTLGLNCRPLWGAVCLVGIQPWTSNCWAIAPSTDTALSFLKSHIPHQHRLCMVINVSSASLSWSCSPYWFRNEVQLLWVLIGRIHFYFSSSDFMY